MAGEFAPSPRTQISWGWGRYGQGWSGVVRPWPLRTLGGAVCPVSFTLQVPGTRHECACLGQRSSTPQTMTQGRLPPTLCQGYGVIAGKEDLAPHLSWVGSPSTQHESRQPGTEHRGVLIQSTASLGQKDRDRPSKQQWQGRKGSHFTVCVLNKALHQHGVLGYTLSDQKNTFLHAEPPHDGKVANFLRHGTEKALLASCLMPDRLGLFPFSAHKDLLNYSLNVGP